MIRVTIMLAEDGSTRLLLRPDGEQSQCVLAVMGKLLDKGARPELVYNSETRVLEIVMPA